MTVTKRGDGILYDAANILANLRLRQAAQARAEGLTPLQWRLKHGDRCSPEAATSSSEISEQLSPDSAELGPPSDAVDLEATSNTEPAPTGN